MYTEQQKREEDRGMDFFNNFEGGKTSRNISC